MINFTHLHVHTQYSILDGAAGIEALIERAKELGMRAIAITDHGNMFGVKEFHSVATKKEILPIIGCEMYVAAKSMVDKTGTEDRAGYHLILLAKNETGYKNLCKLISYAWIDGFYYKPRIDWELLKKYHEGLIASTACLAGEIPAYILNNDTASLEQKISDFKELFGDDFYFELMRHKTSIPKYDNDVFVRQEIVNNALINLSRRHQVKLIATNDVHFIKAGDAQAHDRLLCINTGKLVSDTNRMEYTKQEYLKSAEEMMELFADIPEALENTNEIVEKIESYKLEHKPILPDFPLPEGYSGTYEYLEHLTYEGARMRYKEITDEIKERIEYELSVIKETKFAGYFLIVNDFISAARNMGVWVGPGRGSAAGSVVAYCLRITDLDPLEYGLLFERFLNPERFSMPDMDIDFDEDGREKVIQYVIDKYGESRVAQIITFGTMASKMAIRDVARVENLPLQDADRLAKMVPAKAKDLKEAINMVHELKSAKNSNNQLISRTMKYAEELEGSVRHTGTHACGIIIGKNDLIDHIPLCLQKDSKLRVTQYEGKHVESVGLLKMDFLGLKTLSIIKDAIENIKHSKGIEIDVNQIPLDDEETYHLFSKGNTTGIFQFESDGMKKHLRELKPNQFEDLIAMNALYRPGPMEHIPSYIKRKFGKEKIVYDHPVMELILTPTYGITVYQEQVMNLSREMAGFTRGEADILRKAMGKKDKKLMNTLKEKFFTGCNNNGIKDAIAKKVWCEWESFAEYAFNKSHSACYAITAYRMAYLKAHYQNEFMAAVLSRNVSNIEQITFFIDECKKLNITVLGPDINESQTHFIVNSKGEIRFGLAAIKGLGNAAVDAIITERKNGYFKNIFDFLNRVTLRTVNKKSIEALAMAGAFDSMGIHRAQFFYKLPNEDISFLEKLIRHISLVQNKQNTMQQSLFGESDDSAIPEPELPVCEPWGTIEQLTHEKEVIGFYMSGHPLNDYRIEMDGFTNFKLSQNEQLADFAGREIRFAGMIISATHKIDKNNKPYGFFEIEDMSGSLKLNLWSEQYDKYKHLLEIGKCIFVTAKVDRRYWDNSKKKDPEYVPEYEIRVGSVEPMYNLLEKKTRAVTLYVPLEIIQDEYIENIRNIMDNNSGKADLTVRIIDEEGNYFIDMISRKRKVSGEGFLKGIDSLKNIKYKIN
ncbi:MAG: DNA polymerase III subunit alpha [Bacteroidales bacterium]|jgi:DNA polymerase-3 subunit alpha|nr:DNA polymerase III subunit alpha [Bacteroidales bacterium]